MSVAEKVSDLVSPLCSSANVERVDIELNGGVLKIVIDQSEGLNTEVLADMTREISRQLDHEEPIPGSYTLEVTSPGLERPLKKPQHFEKAVGSLITIRGHLKVKQFFGNFYRAGRWVSSRSALRNNTES